MHPPAALTLERDAQAKTTAEKAVLALADDIFAAARARDANRFASFFSDRPGFAYLINKRRLDSVQMLHDTFASMLGRQSAFEPRWGARQVQLLSPSIAVVTGQFQTEARRLEGDAWRAEGMITFVAVLEPSGWRVVNWHTTE